MAKTYKITENEKEAFVVETDIVEHKKTYQKQWLIDEIARLQVLLDQFK